MNERRRVRRVANSNQVGYKKLEQVKQEKTKLTPKRFIRPIIYITVIGLVFYFILASSFFRIQKIEVAGNQTVAESTIKAQVIEIIGGSPISQNIFFASLQNIDNQLKKNNYQIANTKIDRIYPNKLKVTITEQKPSLLWKSGNVISVFSSNGHAYSGEPSEELKSSLPTVVDTSNLPVKTGEVALAESFVSFVEQLHSKLPENGVKVVEYQVQETTTELFILTQQGYKIRFDTTRPLSEQLTDLVTVLDDLKKQNKAPKEYIDLRINGRVFYK